MAITSTALPSDQHLVVSWLLVVMTRKLICGWLANQMLFWCVAFGIQIILCFSHTIMSWLHSCFQSLAGHTSPVESVQFNPLEESVVAGSQSGTMKIWDVEAAKSKC